jgi:hypothetical protein
VANGLDKIDTEKLAGIIQSHASTSSNEEELKIRVEATLRPSLESLGVKWAAYEHRHELSGGKEDALYGHVIIEYKAPKKLESNAEFAKSKKQVKEYIEKQAGTEENYSKYFGVILDGTKISFVRYRSHKWEEQETPLEVNKETIRTLLRAIRGLRLKIMQPATLVADFGPGDTSRKVIDQLYESLRKPSSNRTKILFEDWKRVFAQACAYSPNKLTALTDYYGLKKHGLGIEKLMFCIHTYYTLLMKFITSEVISYFNPMFGSFLERIESAYETKPANMKKELEELEEGGIIAQLGIRNLLEADYFAWYLDEWSEDTAKAIMLVVEGLKEYDPGTSELYPEKVKDLFKRIYQNLVPRKVRHDLGEYFTPDWLAELTLDEVEYDGNLEKRLLDPACGSGTFLVLAIKRVRAWAESEFYSDKKDLLRKITSNIIGVDLNPLAVLAAKANYILALGELTRLLPGLNIDIPVYLADSILVSRKQSVSGEMEVYLKTAVGDFAFPNEILDKSLLPKTLALIETGMKGDYTKGEFDNLADSQLKELQPASLDSLTTLYMFIRKLEKANQNRIWTRLLKNSFAPLLIGTFDYVVGNPPWINWDNLPERYREDTKQLWNNYGLLEKTGGAGLGKVKRDMAMLFTTRCLDRYVRDKGRFAFLIPYTVYKTQAGAGFRRFLARGIHDATKNIRCKVLKIHDLVTLYPFEGAVNRTSLIIIEKDATSNFPIPCITWHNPKSAGINQEADLKDVREAVELFDLVFFPIDEQRPSSPWMQMREAAHAGMMKTIHESPWYEAHAGVYPALLGAYFVKILSREATGLLITNPPISGQKKKVKQVKAIVEENLVYPFVRGRDVKRWYVVGDYGWIIAPHDPTTGRPLSQVVLKSKYPNSFAYFNRLKPELEDRAIHKLWGKGNPFYSLYDIGPYTYSPYKVVWKRIGGKISGKAEFSAAVMEIVDDKFLGLRPTLPYEKLMLIPFKNEKEAHYVTAILNSSIVQTVVASYLVEQSISDVTKWIKIPRFETANPIQLTLSSLSLKAHKLARAYYEKEDENKLKDLAKCEDEVDQTCATLYGISDDELGEIKRTLQILREGEGVVEDGEDEDTSDE